MKNLIKFELQKMLMSRLTLIAIIAVLLMSVFMSFSTFQNMYSFDGVSNSGKGKAAVEIDKSIAAKYEGVLTDEKVQQIMADVSSLPDMHGANAKYLYQNATQSATFARFSDADGNWNGLSVSDVFGDEEIKIGYVNGWLNTSQSMAKIFLFLSLVAILMVAPVFSGEYGGVDNIILTSRYGKTKCTTAKVLASLFAVVLLTVLVVAINIAFARVAYGAEGLDCSILFAPQEFTDGYIPFNITCGTVIKYQIMLAFTSSVSVTGITLILSAICKNQLIALVTSVTIHVLPMILSISETSSLFRLIVLMPIYHTQYISILSAQQMSGGMLYAIWAIPVALILIVVGYVVSCKVFAKHQVS